MALPCRRLIKPASAPFKAWAQPRKLISPLASNVVQIHQDIRMTIIASTTPTGSFAHNSLLNSRVSRPKAVKNAAVLQFNDVRPSDHPTITDSSRLTTRAVKNTADCTGLRGFQSRGHCYADSGGNYPTTEKMLAAVNEEMGGEVAYDFFRSVLRFCPVLPE